MEVVPATGGFRTQWGILIQHETMRWPFTICFTSDFAFELNCNHVLARVSGDQETYPPVFGSHPKRHRDAQLQCRTFQMTSVWLMEGVQNVNLPPPPKQVRILNVSGSPNQMSANLFGGVPEELIKPKPWTLNPKPFRKPKVLEVLRPPLPLELAPCDLLSLPSKHDRLEFFSVSCAFLFSIL